MPVVLTVQLVLRPDLYAELFFKQLALTSVSKSGLRFLRTQARGESFGTGWSDPIIERQAEAPIGSSSHL